MADITSERIAEAREKFAPASARGRPVKQPFIPRTNAFVTDEGLEYQGRIEPLDFKVLKTADDLLRRLHLDQRNMWVASDKAAKAIARRLAKGAVDFKITHPAKDFDQVTIQCGKEESALRMPGKLTAWGLMEREGKKHRLLFSVAAIDAAMMAYQERFEILLKYPTSKTWLFMLDRKLSGRVSDALKEPPDLAPFDFNLPAAITG